MANALRKLRAFVHRFKTVELGFARGYVRQMKDSPLSFQHKLSAFFRGYYPDSFVIYNLNCSTKRQYISDLTHRRTIFLDGERSLLLSDKVLFGMSMKGVVEVPTDYSLVLEGKITPLDDKITITSVSDILEHCTSRCCNLVIKPIGGSGGRGVMVVAVQNGQVRVNAEAVGITGFCSLIHSLDDYVIQEYIEQNGLISQVFPGAANTVRILTMVEPVTYRPFVAAAVLRIGTNRSAPTDNMHRGGLGAFIDLETGVLSKAAAYPRFTDHKDKMVWHVNHPDTASRIQGLEIPNWREVMDTVLSAARSIPYIPYIGWDVCICEDRIVVLEANSWPGLALFQMHRSLLEDVRIRDFYKHHGIL